MTCAAIAPSEFAEPVGCDECAQSGYRGRTGVYEILPITGEVASTIVRQGPTANLELAAKQVGMTTMLEDGLRKAAAGITSVQEGLRVVS